MISLASVTWAKSDRRNVQFGWETVEGAFSYELELKAKKNGSVHQFKTRKSDWKGRLPIGFYEMRLRALDDREVPGDWSEASPFVVPMDQVKLKSPKDKEQIVSLSTTTADVLLTWEPVFGAEHYEVTATSEDGQVKKTATVPGTEWKVDLDVARNYNWTVQASNENGLKGETVSQSTFEIIGGKLEKAQIAVPENDFVRQLVWSPVERAEKYEVVLDRFDSKTKKWNVVKGKTEVTDPIYQIDLLMPGGAYRARVWSKHPRRQQSEVSYMNFKVRSGDRSPAAEYVYEIRKGIDRINGYYGIASYLLTMVRYSSFYRSGYRGTITDFSAIGGTGRLGLGYMNEKSPWGFIGIVDLSGMTNEAKKTVTFASSEASAILKMQPSQVSEFRIQAGLAYKELPIANADPFTLDVESYSKPSFLAPHVGAEYWYSLTPKLGFQINAHLYQGVLSLQTVRGESIRPSMSYQTGLLGSYRLSRKSTGLMGYARRVDRINFGTNGTAAITGDYVNWFLEYGF